MTRSDLIAEIEEEYRVLRQRDEDEAVERAERARELDPVIGELMDGKVALFTRYSRRMLADKANAAAYGEEMRAEGLKLNAEIRERLAAVGMEADALEVKYRCPICSDTGYTGQPPREMCECFKKRMHDRLSADRGLAALEKESFETFRDELIPDTYLESKKTTQRLYTRALMEACKKYADSYPNADRPNLLMYGPTGLGKTFLLNAVAGRLYGRGVPVIRVTAYTMFEAMRKYHFDKEAEDAMTFDDLLSAPVLLIDDLGTEPMQKNITCEYLFNLLNERLHSGLCTVIATNLSPMQIYETYGERVGSRLCDRANCAAMLFTGKDLRSL